MRRCLTNCLPLSGFPLNLRLLNIFCIVGGTCNRWIGVCCIATFGLYP
uniref:Uncharacterized protein n=1 Tax=Rhizophora mucronata TaxID=61149 RepID=A0A2P2PB52_RHIMU